MPQRSEREGRRADRQRCDDDICSDQSQRYSDRHRIDARANGSRNQNTQRVAHRLLPPIVAMHALPNHFAADDAEHDECNPVIEGANKAAGRDAGPPTDYRSDRFDEAEDQACPQSFG